MRKLLILLTFITVMVLASCVPATKDSIKGTWKITHALTFAIDDGIYYNFDADTYNSDADKAEAESSKYRSPYTLAADGLLDLGILEYKALIVGDIMYWYVSDIETFRLKKQ